MVQAAAPAPAAAAAPGCSSAADARGCSSSTSGPLRLLFVTAFWTVDSFTGQIVRDVHARELPGLVTDPAYYGVALRTIGIAAAVTVLCRVIGLPMAFFMARVAKPAHRGRCSSRWC